MSPSEIAAYIGAAAWLPPIILLIIKAATKPRLDSRLAHSISLSDSPFGAVIGLNVALFADKRDALITNITLRITHEKGEERLLRWDALQETFLGIRGLPEALSFENTQPALALKIPTSNVTHRLIWFVDYKFKSQAQQTLAILIQHAEFLKSRSEKAETDLRSSKEFAESKDIFAENFFWREGEYNCRLHIEANKVIRDKKFRFLLPKTDAAKLRMNLDNVDAYLLKSTLNTDNPINWSRSTVPVFET